MVIERWTFPVKVACQSEFIELTKASVAESGLTPRVYTYIIGPHDVVIFDGEMCQVHTIRDMTAYRRIAEVKVSPPDG